MINGCGEGPEVRGSNPVWSFVDLTGKQFDDTFYMWVLENDVPYIPATVWHDPAGTIPWTDPIRFLANGTLPIDIYWDPSKFYRLEFRHNVGPLPPSQSDPLIYLVENYSPNNAPMTPIGGDGITTDNLISNPQFSNMNFSEPFVLTAATNPASIEVAPGWFLDLVGTGNATIERVPFNTNNSTPTNAPYALHLDLAGWTDRPTLRQRFQQNGQNWRDKTVSASLTARIVGNTAPFNVRLVASNGQPLAVIINDFFTNSFQEFSGAEPVTAYANLDVPPAAYIDYILTVPTTCDIYVTSFQLVVSDVAAPFAYEQTTVDRQIDHLFHYYQPKIQYMPISSYLVGWDFPLNPAQIAGDAPAAQGIANQAYYAWDQTILFQTAAASITTARGANGSLQLTCAVAGQVAIIQYLDQTQARKILNDRSSVHMSLYGASAAAMHGNVTLWATTDANLPTLPAAFMTAMDADGIPTAFNTGNWVQVPNVFQNTEFDVPAVSATNSELNDINLNGWDLAGAVPSNTATFFAIVIGFSAWAPADVLNVNSIALCPGDIATRPMPKTQDETLRDCERYFEMSYQNFAAVGTATLINALTAQMSRANTGVPGPGTFVVEQGFGFEFRTLKRTINSVITLYDTSAGTIANVTMNTFPNATLPNQPDPITNWGTVVKGDKAVNYRVTAYSNKTSVASAAGGVSSWITYQYKVDARLGVVN